MSNPDSRQEIIFCLFYGNLRRFLPFYFTTSSDQLLLSKAIHGTQLQGGTRDNTPQMKNQALFCPPPTDLEIKYSDKVLPFQGDGTGRFSTSMTIRPVTTFGYPVYVMNWAVLLVYCIVWFPVAGRG